MSSAGQTLNEVSLLHSALSGVSVRAARFDNQNGVLDVLVHGGHSAHLVKSLCEAANASLQHPVRLRDPELRSGETKKLLISAGIERFDSIEFGRLQLLGIHLVWHLHRTAEISAEAANELLQQWHGARVGA